jgi:hypothetical protein
MRRPLDRGEELAVIGLSMQFFSAGTAFVLAVQIAFKLRRMRNAEIVLAESFPEYAAYRQRTARLLPGMAKGVFLRRPPHPPRPEPVLGPRSARTRGSLVPLPRCAGLSGRQLRPALDPR